VKNVSFEAGITFFVIILMFAALLTDRYEADVVMFLSLISLMLFGIVSPQEALVGFSNEGVMTIAALFVIVSSIQHSSLLHMSARLIFGTAKTLSSAVGRMMFLVSTLSAFFNNTPLVALFMPIVKSWARHHGYPVSKLLIPLSYAAILGGMCTLIGTSTNLVVSSLLKMYGHQGLSMFELALVGIPCSIVGLLYMIFIGGKLLPKNPSDNKLLVTSYVREEKKHIFFECLPILIVIAMILSVSIGILPMVTASFTAAGILLITRCTSLQKARKAIEWNIILLIGSAFGIAKALETTGAAELVATFAMIYIEGLGPYAVLAAIYLITSLLTEMITNNATAALVFPIMISITNHLALNPEPFAIAIAIAASASFATPIGYQTNLMVYGSGEYKFVDFLKIGLPLNIICMVVSILVIPIFWPM
jgi:anion transporter